MSRREIAWFSALLGAAALVYLWNLPLNGWGNAYYAAAAQAGATDWKAFFFGASDAGNGITVDKLPGSIWVAALSIRLFGLSSWSLLAPQALMGVGTVALTYLIVRRHFSFRSAMLAGVILLLTPAAAIMSRYNNPDALLTFLLTLSVYFMVRASEDGRWRWLLLTGLTIGAGFLTKSAQALLLIPVLGLVYLYAGPAGWRRKWTQLAAAFLMVAATAASWLLIAESIPPASRPYAGGSFQNSFLEVVLRQNGLGRILGAEGGGTPGAEQAPAGPLRLMVYASFGTQGAWLLPIALVFLLCSLVLLRRRPGRDPQRALVLLAGGWLVAYAVTFSFMSGVIHPYYLSTLAPAIAILMGAGWQLVWPARRWLVFRLLMAVSVLFTATLSFGYLSKGGGPGPILSMVVLLAGLVACELLIFRIRRLLPNRITLAAVTCVCLIGPIAYTVTAAVNPHIGVSPAATLPGSPAVLDSPDESAWPVSNGIRTRGSALGHRADPEVVNILMENGSGYRWAAAVPGALNAGLYQLAAQVPVMPLGGFNGGTPYPSLDQFKSYVASGQIRYLVLRHDGQDIAAEAGFADEVTRWARETFTSERIGDADILDLTKPRAPSA